MSTTTDPKVRTLKVRVSETLAREIELLARKQDVSQSEVLRRLAKEEIKRHPVNRVA